MIVFYLFILCGGIFIGIVLNKFHQLTLLNAYKKNFVSLIDAFNNASDLLANCRYPTKDKVDIYLASLEDLYKAINEAQKFLLKTQR